jgi:CelD/BcsL family acetyltransferase involved in cellulose biosynthesis
VSELALLELDDARWSEFAGGRNDVLPFHLPAWTRVLAECYGFRPFVAVLLQRGAVEAGLPVLEIRRRRWVALPFTDVCPPLGPAGPLAAALDAARGQATLEVRSALPGAPGVPAAWQHVLALDRDPELTRAGFHRSQVQRNIKRAEREGVVVRTATVEADLTEIFYALHLRTRRRLGAPVQRRRFFSLLWRHLLAEGHGYALIAEHEGVPAAAAVFLTAGPTVVYKYGASDERLWGVRPNHALFWHAIRASCVEGRTRLDFGRTDFDDTGLREFKLGWGAAEERLVYSTLGGRLHAPPLHTSAGSAAARRVLRTSPPWVCRAAGLLYGYAA